MTGGQSDLDFSVSSVKQEENVSSNQLNSELNLRVIELTEEENKSHKDYLRRMKEETGTDPLGLN